MTEDPFPATFDPTRCILFLGAGFSADATNKRNERPPVGLQLAHAIRDLAGLPTDDQSELMDLAQYAISEKKDLYALLEGIFTIRTLTDAQQKTLSQPWLRIYTTNYDNSISVHRSNSGNSATKDIYDLTDPPPRRVPRGAAIHLHGSIAKCDSNNLHSTLVLSRKSYVEQRVKESAWWNWFDHDLRACTYAFFLGYELSDFEPASYLMRYPGLKKRCHFVLRNPKSPVAAAKLSDYGTRHSFELSGFVERLSRARIAPKPSHPDALTSLRYIDLNKDNKLISKPSSAEIQELLAFGRKRFDAMRAVYPNSDYAVTRIAKLRHCAELITKATTIVIHGKIGNGKSTFSDLLKLHLSSLGFSCFTLRENFDPSPDDMAFIASMKDPVVFVSNYDAIASNKPLFEEAAEKVRFVVEISSSVLYARSTETVDRLPGRIERVNIDRLETDDIRALHSLLEKAGLTSLKAFAPVQGGLEFRDFLLAAYEAPEVANRLVSVVNVLLKSSSIRRVLTATAIAKACGAAVDASFIAAVAGHDPYLALEGAKESSAEFIYFGLDKIESHSSIVSLYILRKFIDKLDFGEAVFGFAHEAARRISAAGEVSSDVFRASKALLSSVLRFSFLEDVVGQYGQKALVIGALYEKCRNDLRIQTEPLFWLQYSIYWQDCRRWDMAESHMKEAYARAAAISGFKTYQLDTNYLGLLCDLEVHSSVGNRISRFEALLKLVGICGSMIDDGNHRAHALRSLLKIEALLKRRRKDLSDSEAATFTYAVRLIETKLAALSPEEKATHGTEMFRQSLERSIRILTA